MAQPDALLSPLLYFDRSYAQLAMPVRCLRLLWMGIRSSRGRQLQT